MNVEVFTCNPFDEHCFLLWEEGLHNCIIIDPGMCCDAEWHRLHAFMQSHELTPDYVLLTHSHTDHVMGTGYLARQYPSLPIYGSMEDQNHLPSVHTQNTYFGVDVEVHYAPITHDLRDGDRLPASPLTGAQGIQVIDCPGHSHHGLCYYLADGGLLFSGDVLFYCSVGRFDFGPAMGGNGPQLVKGIIEKLLVLPTDVKVYPGHGPMTTIGTEATYNPYL